VLEDSVMSDDTNRQIAERYLKALPMDFETLEALRDPGYVEDWPQSKERIRGHAAYREIHERYPAGKPQLAPERVSGSEDRWVSTPMYTALRVSGSGDIYTLEALATYPDGTTSHFVSIVELRDQKVFKQTTYFADPFDPPEWRADLVGTVD
jgi:hypothetical protein